MMTRADEKKLRTAAHTLSAYALNLALGNRLEPFEVDNFIAMCRDAGNKIDHYKQPIVEHQAAIMIDWQAKSADLQEQLERRDTLWGRIRAVFAP